MSERTIKSFVQQSIDKYLEKRQNLCKEFTSSKMERIKKHNIQNGYRIFRN